MACPYDSRRGVTLREAVGVQGKGQGPISEDGSAGRRHFVTAAPSGVVREGAAKKFGRGRSLCCAAILDTGRVRTVDSRFRGSGDLQGARPQYRHSRESGNPLLMPESQFFAFFT